MDIEDIDLIILNILCIIISALASVSAVYFYYGHFTAIHIILTLLFDFIFYVTFSFIRLWLKYR